MSYRFELANPADEAQIRRLLRQNPVPGQMALTYEREPDYALGTSVMGHLCQTLVARQQASDAVVAVATRSIRSLFVNGQVQAVGYIGQLRVDPLHQGRWLLPQGFRLFHELHQDGATRGYITTIIQGNTQAEGLLVHKARRTLPVYRPLGQLFTMAIIVGRPRRPHWGSMELRSGDTVAVDDLIAFLHRNGSQRQFFPAYRVADFDEPATRDFSVADFVVACRHGRIVGVAGLWDQSGYKQMVVRAHSPTLRRLRPFYKGVARLLGAQPLPDVGQPIRFGYASFLCVEEADASVCQQLLTALHNRAAQWGLAFLMVGLTDRDPLLPVVRKRLHIPYLSTLYAVCWPEDEAWYQELDGRVPYVEIATL